METRTLEVNEKIYTSTADLNFANRYQFNPQNLISNLEFDLSIENIISKIWKPKLAA